MKRYSIYKYLLGFLGFLSLGLASCSIDNLKGDVVNPDTDETTMLVLRVNPLNSIGTRAGSEAEKIQNVRIVILNAFGSVEINEFRSLGDAKAFESNQIIETFYFQITPGRKKIYLLANEESVININETQESLKSSLEKYKPGSNNFESFINTVYFSPKYSTGLLPYSSYYECELIKGIDNTQTFFIVPIATKFTFNFVNEREEDVVVNDISISSIASENYVFGNVNQTDYNKTFNGQSYYWVDWLREVSEASWNAEPEKDNIPFNGQYGWIKDYNLPKENNHNIKSLLAGPVTIDRNHKLAGTAKNPDLGPFYLPESKYVLNNNQVYKFSISVDDNQTFNDINLDNLQALFRNTHVNITITMNKLLDIEISYTVCPWDIKTINIPSFQ